MYVRLCPKCLKLSLPIEFKSTNKLSHCLACSKARYKAWVTANRNQVNSRTREYRAKRYKENGKWREEGPKARALKLWMEELKSKPCADCGRTVSDLLYGF